MEPQEFRKLDIDLPRQPLSNQQPWLIAGLILALAILLFSVYAYMGHIKQSINPSHQKDHIIKNR